MERGDYLVLWPFLGEKMNLGTSVRDDCFKKSLLRNMSGVTVSRKYSDHMQSPVKHSVIVYYKDQYPGHFFFFY